MEKLTEAVSAQITELEQIKEQNGFTDTEEKLFKFLLNIHDMIKALSIDFSHANFRVNETAVSDTRNSDNLSFSENARARSPITLNNDHAPETPLDQDTSSDEVFRTKRRGDQTVRTRTTKNALKKVKLSTHVELNSNQSQNITSEDKNIHNTTTDVHKMNNIEEDIMDTSNLNDVNDKTPNVSENSGKTPKLPPITLKPTTMKWSEICTEFHARKLKFFGQRINGKIKVTAFDADNYRSIVKVLREFNIEHHSFILPQDRNIKAVIKGLNEDTEIDEIKTRLEELGYVIEHIKQMTKRRNGEVFPLPIFIVTLPKTVQSKKIYNEKFLCDLCVKIQEYKGRQGPLQCFRCQGFNHTQLGCNYSPKCVKCGESHFFNDCPVKNDKDFTPVCVNCGNSHTASFRGCEKFPKPKTDQPKTFSNRVVENKSYAKALSTGIYSDTLSEAKKVFADLAELVSVIKTAGFQLTQQMQQINKCQENTKTELNNGSKS